MYFFRFFCFRRGSCAENAEVVPSVFLSSPLVPMKRGILLSSYLFLFILFELSPSLALSMRRNGTSTHSINKRSTTLKYYNGPLVTNPTIHIIWYGTVDSTVQSVRPKILSVLTQNRMCRLFSPAFREVLTSKVWEVHDLLQ